MLWQLAQACSRLYIDHVCTKVGSKAVDGFLQRGVAGGAKIHPEVASQLQKDWCKAILRWQADASQRQNVEFSNRVSAKGKRFTSRFLTQLKS